MKKIKKRRLKIAEQMIIVVFVAVIIPLVISALIITNVNQQALRKEIVSSTFLSINSIKLYLETEIEGKKLLAKNIGERIEYTKYPENYFKEIKKNYPEILDIRLMPKNIEEKVGYNKKKNSIIISQNTDYGKHIEIEINARRLEADAKKDFSWIVRKIYILDENNQVILPKDYNEDGLRALLAKAPNDINDNAKLFYFKKNEPNMILQLKNPKWKIIVTTPKVISKYTIGVARYRIIAVLGITAIAIIFFCLVYLLYLYTNIRQLFKAINAVADGNYNRKVRPIVNFTTPNEVIFLSKEFNKMVERIKNDHKELKKKNLQLKQLDSFRANLVDTVSHEFRTPLTSIKGYTSRLLRQDVVIDKKMQQDSLKVIKRQTERLGRMVEDLLVIPDIETATIKIFPQEIFLKDILANVLMAIRASSDREFEVDIPANLSPILADPDRTEQILVNLIENALKYSISAIKITAKENFRGISISVENECPTIEKKKLSSLFEKFTRLDDTTTRTTRGTGLGLFIVKGLVKAMNGKITASSNNNFKITFTLPKAR